MLAVRDTVLALYLVQQAVEKACKALLLEWGEPFESVFDIRHRPVAVFRKFADALQEKADIVPSIIRLVGENSFNNLRKFETENWDELTVMPRESVRIFLSIREKLNTEWIRKTKSFPRTIPLSFPVGVPEMISHEIARKLPEFHGEGTLEFARLLMSANVEIPQKDQGQLVTIKLAKKQINWYGRQTNARTGLFVLGAITFSHEAYARYPARPDSPSRAVEAIKERRRGKFGIQHYDGSIGVFASIEALVSETEAVLNDLTARMPSL